MAIRKTEKGASLKRWFAEKWTDEKGNPCGSTKNKSVKACRPSKRVNAQSPKPKDDNYGSRTSRSDQCN